MRALLIFALLSATCAFGKSSSGSGYHSPNASAGHSGTYSPYGYSSKGGTVKAPSTPPRARDWAVLSTGGSVVGGSSVKTTSPLLFRRKADTTPRAPRK